jgi:dynein heavy chain
MYTYIKEYYPSFRFFRSSISAAKQNLKILEFCDNEKLLERFKESDLLLNQVQKGLSDYLETKRSVFSRYILYI